MLSIECIWINCLWKDTQEAGTHDYLWEREGELGSCGNGIVRETTVYPFIAFKNCTVWKYYFFTQ